MDVVCYALKMAKENNVTTILNPAPAAKLDKEIFPLIDYFTPNETEASFYVDHNVETHEDAEKAAMQLLEKGIKNVFESNDHSTGVAAILLDKETGNNAISVAGAGFKIVFTFKLCAFFNA